jgi:hypothetical protein
VINPDARIAGINGNLLFQQKRNVKIPSPPQIVTNHGQLSVPYRKDVESNAK